MAQSKLISFISAAAFGFGLVVASGAAETARAAVVTYDFEAQPIGTNTPLSVTDNGVTATFSSPADPGSFVISESFFITLTGHVLDSPGSAGVGNIPLNISFSQPVDQISLVFALDVVDDNTIPLVLTTNTGGSASATTTGFAFPEGALSFSGAAFTSIDLSTSAPFFAVDNLVLDTAEVAVPEPSSLAMLGAGLLGMWSLHRRQRRFKAPPVG